MAQLYHHSFPMIYLGYWSLRISFLYINKYIPLDASISMYCSVWAIYEYLYLVGLHNLHLF